MFEKRPPLLEFPNKDFGYSPSLGGANKLPPVKPPKRPAPELFVFCALTPPKIDGLSSFELLEEKLNKLLFGGLVVVFPNKLVPAGKVVVNLKPVEGFYTILSSTPLFVSVVSSCLPGTLLFIFTILTKSTSDKKNILCI